MKDYDIPFSSDDTHRFLPLLISLMVGMAALLLCLGTSINGWVVDRHGSYTNNFTVDIPAQSDDGEAKISRVRDAVQKIPGVANVQQLSDDRIRQLLKPWFGSGDVIADLPLPAVLEVKLTSHMPLDYNVVQKELAAIVPGTQVDTRERWVSSFTEFAGALQALVTLLAIAIAIAMAVTISFASRASLHLHGRTVNLLHSMGAEDGYIASQFQREAFLLTLRGSLVGSVSAGLFYLLIGKYVASLQVASLPSLYMGLPHVALLLLLPLACGCVAWGATFVTVRRQLQKVL